VDQWEQELRDAVGAVGADPGQGVGHVRVGGRLAGLGRPGS
jgi:hypothetical protein